MKNKIYLIFIPILIVIGGTILYYVMDYLKPIPHSLSQETIEKSDFLKKQKAAVYFSTTSDQDVGGDGLGLTVFIDRKNQAKSFSSKGLELNNLAISPQNDLLLVDSEKMRLLGSSYKEFNLKKPQYMGEQTGYIPKKQLFFSLFNTGFDKQNQYTYTLSYGNESGFKEATIPFYINATGIGQDRILLLTTQNVQEENSPMRIQDVTFSSGKMKLAAQAELKIEGKNEIEAFSSILSDADYYYVVLKVSESDHEENSKLVMQRIDKNSDEQKTFLMDSYKKEEDSTASIPYNIKNSSHLYKGIIYYIDGNGTIMTFDTKTTKINKKFKLEQIDQEEKKHHEESFFNGNSLFMLRYDPKSAEKYLIETYSLSSGKKVTESKIKGLNEILDSTQTHDVFSYDFRMLN